jgi:hypothetical protein
MDRRRTMMNAFRKVLIGIGALAVVALGVELAAPRRVHAVVSALVTVANTTSNPVPTIDATQSVSQNVALLGVGYAGYPISFSTVNPDGSKSSSAFKVPDGQTLVITDVDFTPDPPMSVGGFLLIGTNDTYQWGATGPATTHFSYRTGIVVGTGNSLSVAEFPGGGRITIAVHGYLVPAS